MKKEEFGELLTDIDERFIKEAYAPPAKARIIKLSWVKGGVLAACLCLVVLGAYRMLPREEEQVNNGIAVASRNVDVAPMVCVNDVLYKQSVDGIFFEEEQSEFVYLGEIETCITGQEGALSDGVPTENFQANIPIAGAKVYQYGEEKIAVCVDGFYWLYERTE